jgi:IS5 family transposase
MRVVKNKQMILGETDIAAIKFNPKSRDDIDQILKGLQYIYCQAEMREELFSILEKMTPAGVNKNNGRPGIELWKIFVLAILRLNLNWDYDRLLHMANHNNLIRQMLGHAEYFDDEQYELQTLKDNFKLLTPEIMEEINQFVVNCGHGLVKKKEKDEQGNISLKCRGDSFVVKTDVHFPTDINLLFDAMRKVIELTGKLCESLGINGWRQYQYNIKQIKKFYRIAQQSKRSTSKDAQENIQQAHKEYIKRSGSFLDHATLTLNMITSECSLSAIDLLRIEEINQYINHAKRQINQIDRRILRGEKIHNQEKVFSLFEPHTEWIMKGKAGVPVELGVKVGIIEDQYRFILHHRVMQKEADAKVAVNMVKETKEKFPGMDSISYDKGYYSSENREQLDGILPHVALPKKGKLSSKDKEIQNSESYKQAKNKHSAIESAINALDVHGLDKCPDHGINGFKRYVAIAIVSRNVQRIGAIIHQRDQKLHEKRERRKRLKLAA